MYINHVTLNTGHLARSERSGVGDEALSIITPWLMAVANAGAPVPLCPAALSHFSATAIIPAGALVVTVYAPAGPHMTGETYTGESVPLITMGVAQRSRHGMALWDQLVGAFGSVEGLNRPSEPWCAVALHPSAALSDAVDWLGDFERCVAWAWITRNPALHSVP